ncbi:MAG: threonine/serine exporter ThrE family protein [Pseudonocardia sp.]
MLKARVTRRPVRAGIGARTGRVAGSLACLLIVLTTLVGGCSGAVLMRIQPVAPTATTPPPSPPPPTPTTTGPTTTPTPTPTPTTTPAPAPPTAATTTPGRPTSTTEPTEDPDATTEAPTTRPTPSTAPVRPATPPAVTTVDHSPLLIGSAVLVLVAAIGAAGLLVRRARSERPEAVPSPPPLPPSTPVAGSVVMLSELGEAMLDSGYDVETVREAVAEVAAVNGIPRAEIITLPTAMFASAVTDGRLETSAVATGGVALQLHQIEDLSTVVAAARVGRIDPATARERVRAIRTEAPVFGPLTRVAGNVLAAAGLAVLLGGAWADITVAAALGGLVGVLLLVQLPQRYQVLIVLAAAFAVGLVVFLAARTGLPLVILPSLLAPLVTLLPGAALTTGAVELSTGQMISGAGRIAAGGMQLVLLALGITGAAALTGVPVIELDTPTQPLGPLAPWIAVAVFGVGILVNRSARPRSFGWILLVLYVAYGAQVVGDALFGSVLSAFVGAAAMTPVADVISRVPGGPPTMVSFLPAYWLLVPGAVGLEGVTSLLDGDSSGLATLTATLTTMVAISLGVLVGFAISTFTRRVTPPGRADGSARER